MWQGTERGCYNRYGFGDPWVETYDDFASRSYRSNSDGYNQRPEHCDMIFPRSASYMDTFYGRKVCARRGGTTYKDAVRVDFKGECPDGYSKCSS